MVTEDPDFDEFEQWKAKVLEIRACGSEHVFIRVAWLNRPEDLDDGHQEYHGERELIPTNKMDIINGMSVNGRCSVKYSNDPQEWAALDCDEYYWRQTWDSITRKLSVGSTDLAHFDIGRLIFRTDVTKTYRETIVRSTQRNANIARCCEAK